MTPKILISTNKPNYPEAIKAAGGEPTVGATAAEVESFDGLLITGGADIAPHRYGEEICGSVNINEELDAYELALVDAFVKAGKPILGICRGYQLINIYFGGSLIQHIDTADSHRGEGDAVHTVDSAEDSLLTRLYGRHFAVNSSHHQAVKKLGVGLRLTQISDADGVVEGYEHTTLPIIGVQWHPERTTLAHARPDTVDGGALFSHFIELCKAEKKGK